MNSNPNLGGDIQDDAVAAPNQNPQDKIRQPAGCMLSRILVICNQEVAYEQRSY